MRVSKSEAGYTLTEMLAALLILGLATGGLVEGGFALSRLQMASAARVRAFTTSRGVQARFAGLLAAAGPFRSTGQDFEGTAEDFHFACGSALCGAGLRGNDHLELDTPTALDLSLGQGVEARFLYVGSATTQETWPPTGGTPQRLQSVLLVSGRGDGEIALATADVWRQEEPTCAFDAIVKDCRGGHDDRPAS